jgi:hypothetical protein
LIVPLIVRSKAICRAKHDNHVSAIQIIQLTTLVGNGRGEEQLWALTKDSGTGQTELRKTRNKRVLQSTASPNKRPKRTGSLSWKMRNPRNQHRGQYLETAAYLKETLNMSSYCSDSHSKHKLLQPQCHFPRFGKTFKYSDYQ